jgi:hypothetical protein
MGISQRRKGQVGELSAIQALKDLFGWRGHRSAMMQTQNRAGREDECAPDIEIAECPDLWFEIKRVEKLSIPRVLALAVKQAGRRCPIVMHRPNRSVNGWMLSLRLQDLPRIVHAYNRAVEQEIEKGGAVSAADVSAADASDNQGTQRNKRVVRVCANRRKPKSSIDSSCRGR